MQKPTVTHATFTIERHYPAPLDRLYRAFTDPAMKRDWFAGGKSSTLEEFTMDFRPGGHDYTRTRFPPGSPFPGAALENHTVYQDIVGNQRIVLAYTMSVAGRRISASLATFEFFASHDGSTLLFTEQAAFFEGADGPAMREDGWNQLLNSLAAHLAA
ncbi:MAG: SRPBCC family protein [Bryobacterales bacterium]|nr:SRPBCC family protein [Bryobacterales bacterium]